MEEIKVSEMLQADSIEKDNAVMIIQDGVNKKASGSIQTATGTSLSLTSVADTCKVKSNSENLFDKDNYIETKLFINAGSSTYSEAGALYGAIINVTSYTNLTLTKTKGTRFGIFASTSYPAVGVSGTILQDSASTTSPKTIDVSNYNYMVVSFYSSSSDTLSKSEILDTIQIEEGSTATSYSPYNTEVGIFGKNLFDQSKIVNPPAGGATPGIILTLKPNTAYTMSTNCVKSVDDTTLIFFASGTSSTGLSTAVNGVWNGQTRTFTSDSNGHMIVVYRRNTRDTDIDLTDYWYQIEEGSTATTYEKFEGQYLDLIPDETKSAFTYDSLTNIISNGSVTIEYNTQARLLNNDDLEPVKEYVDRIAEEKSQEIYSTDEMRVGTWINGKPLYRKVITGTKNHNDTLMSNVSELINCYGTGTSGTNKRTLPYYEYYNNTKYAINVYQNGSNIKTEIDLGGTQTATLNITLEYTKTTD